MKNFKRYLVFIKDYPHKKPILTYDYESDALSMCRHFEITNKPSLFIYDKVRMIYTFPIYGEEPKNAAVL